MLWLRSSGKEKAGTPLAQHLPLPPSSPSPSPSSPISSFPCNEVQALCSVTQCVPTDDFSTDRTCADSLGPGIATDIPRSIRLGFTRT